MTRGLVHPLVIGNGGEIRLRSDAGNLPRLSSILCKGEVRPIFLRVPVVSSRNDSALRVTKVDGKDPRGIRPVHNGRLKNLPALAAIGRMEDASGLTSRREPQVAVVRIWQNRDTAI